jgi:hypothetical protein
MKLRPFPFIFKLVISYQILLALLLLCMSVGLAIVANLFFIYNSSPTTTNFNFSLYNPQLGMILVAISMLIGLISIWGLIAAINLFYRKKWAWVASVLWHGLIMLPLILLVMATFSSSGILVKLLSSFMLSMSFFTLVYFNKPAIKPLF